MNADFLINIAYLLSRDDRVRMLKIALQLADSSSIDFARVFYELSPFLEASNKRMYGNMALESMDCSLGDIVVLLTCSNYLRKDRTVERMKVCLDSFRNTIVPTHTGTTFLKGFVSLMIQQSLAFLADYERDSASVTANLAEQDELLKKAAESFRGSKLWSARTKIGQAWVNYYRGFWASIERAWRPLYEAKKRVEAAKHTLKKLDDYASLYLAFRLLFLIEYRRFMMSSTNRQKAHHYLRSAKHHAKLQVELAQIINDPNRLAGAYTNLGICYKYQGLMESNAGRRKSLLERAREMHLSAVSTVKGVNEESVPLHLYNAATILGYLSVIETNVADLQQLIERTLKEMDEVIRLSSIKTEPRIRLGAIIGKLGCLQGLAEINLLTVTDTALNELESLNRDLKELGPQVHEPQIIGDAYLSLSLYCLELIRIGGNGHELLIKMAEESTLKAYDSAEAMSSYLLMGQSLYSLANIFMMKGISNYDVRAAEQASYLIDKACQLFARTGDPRIGKIRSRAAEIYVVGYGCTGDPADLDKATCYSRESISSYVRLGNLQAAGEESFKLATIYILKGEDGKAGQALDQSARFFEKFGEVNPQLRRELVNSSIACQATRRLVKAQIAYNAGNESRAKRLVEQAENQLIQAHARWREVWLVRGFKELISGNLDEAKNNLERVIKDSHDAMGDRNPVSTGYSARRLIDFISGRLRNGRALPPTIIDLPPRSESILTAIRMEALNKQLSSVPTIKKQEEQNELSLEEIREFIKEISRKNARQQDRPE